MKSATITKFSYSSARPSLKVVNVWELVQFIHYIHICFSLSINLSLTFSVPGGMSNKKEILFFSHSCDFSDKEVQMHWTRSFTIPKCPE